MTHCSCPRGSSINCFNGHHRCLHYTRSEKHRAGKKGRAFWPFSQLLHWIILTAPKPFAAISKATGSAQSMATRPRPADSAGAPRRVTSHAVHPNPLHSSYSPCYHSIATSSLVQGHHSHQRPGSFPAFLLPTLGGATAWYWHRSHAMVLCPASACCPACWSCGIPCCLTIIMSMCLTDLICFAWTWLVGQGLAEQSAPVLCFWGCGAKGSKCQRLSNYTGFVFLNSHFLGGLSYSDLYKL